MSTLTVDTVAAEESSAESDSAGKELHISAWRRELTVRVLQVALLCLALGLWQWLAGSSKTLSLAVSTPWEVMRWMANWATNGSLPHGNGWSDLAVTLQEAAYGYLLGVAGGLALGTVFAKVNWIRSFIAPYVAAANALPKIALAPLFIFVLGSSLSMKVYFVAASTFFITFYAVFNGLRSIPPVLISNGRVLGANAFWMAKEIYAPAMFGWIIAGLRVTASWAIGGAVVVELLVANAGMGFEISSGQASANVPQAIGAICIVSLAAVIVDRLLLVLSRHLASWRAS